MPTAFRYHHQLRVRFAETDMQGIVFNGNYLIYFDVAWTEYIRAQGMTYQEMAEKFGTDTVLVGTTVHYRSPARFDDLLDIHTRVGKIGNTSLTVEFEIRLHDDDRLVATGENAYVFVKPGTQDKMRVPDGLRDLFSTFEGRPLDAV